jgi:hypothetical protein
MRMRLGYPRESQGIGRAPSAPEKLDWANRLGDGSSPDGIVISEVYSCTVATRVTGMTKRLIVGMSSCRAAALPAPHRAKADADELAQVLRRTGLFGSGGRTLSLPGGDSATPSRHDPSPDGTRSGPDIDRHAPKH